PGKRFTAYRAARDGASGGRAADVVSPGRGVLGFAAGGWSDRRDGDESLARNHRGRRDEGDDRFRRGGGVRRRRAGRGPAGVAAVPRAERLGRGGRPEA